METHGGIQVKINDEGVILVKLTSKDAIYAAHMQFLKGGGVFIPTTCAYQLGDEVKILLTILDEQQQYLVTGKVVWHTPIGAQGGLTAGIGIQFRGENVAEIVDTITSLLEGMMSSDRPTETM